MDAALASRIAGLAAEAEGLGLLVLFGSRARGDERAGSDWDFGYLAESGFDPLGLVVELVRAVGSERVDLVDLGRAGALLRFRAARDGRCLFERREREFEDYQLAATRTWCDMEPVLRRAYEDVLAELRA